MSGRITEMDASIGTEGHEPIWLNGATSRADIVAGPSLFQAVPPMVRSIIW